MRPIPATLLAAMLVALAACGFRPLYGEGSAGSAETLAQIEVNRIPDRIGQQLRNLLLFRLTPGGQPVDPLYTLDVSVAESVVDVAVREDESATRANLTVVAQFRLSRAGGPGGERTEQTPTVHAGKVIATTSYNRLQSEYATLAAENDARDRALRQIAENIRLRLAIALENPAAQEAPQPARGPVPVPKAPPDPVPDWLHRR